MPAELALTPEAIAACFPAMLELRPHLQRADFLQRIQRQQAQGYRLVSWQEAGAVKCVAGFRVSECLAWGKFMYVDDFVTLASAQKQGFAEQLFGWLLEQARAEACEQLCLDSGVHRFDAHRFYLKQHMHISSHHFSLALNL